MEIIYINIRFYKCQICVPIYMNINEIGPLHNMSRNICKCMYIRIWEAYMYSIVLKAFFVPVLELLVVVLVRIVNVFLWHSRRRTVVTAENTKAVHGSAEGLKCWYKQLTELGEHDLSSAADNSNLNGRLWMVDQHHVGNSVTNRLCIRKWLTRLSCTMNLIYYVSVVCETCFSAQKIRKITRQW